MKKHLLILLVALVGVTTTVMAQELDPKWGAISGDREQNVKDFQRFSDEYKFKNYEESLLFLKKLLVNAPACSENLYVRGIDIYKEKLKKAKSNADKDKYMDSIMTLFDLRAENFATHKTRDKGWTLGQKALTFFQLSPEDNEKIIKYFNDAITTAGPAVDPDIVLVYFNHMTELFDLNDVTPEVYLGDYERLTSILQAEPNDKTDGAMSNMEALFIKSGAASCENIEKIFKPKYEADPENEELLKKILGLFSRSKCSNEFQQALVEKFYTKNPTPEMALMLAEIYEGKKNYSKAMEYIEFAITNEKDPAQKLNHLMRAASSMSAIGNSGKAAEYARQVIALDPANGYAHLIYATSLASGAATLCGDSFDKRAAYWLVVDKLVEARKYFTQDAGQTDNINSMINSYSSNFPKAEETFLRDLKPGDAYTVSCGWVSGRTTVRER